MKFFLRYIFPGIFGLLVYATIRVINDTLEGFNFWERDWKNNAIEISCSIVAGYMLIFVTTRIFQRFDKKLQQTFSYKTVLTELLWVFFATELCMNALITPMAALTDDGLSWGDLAIINIIPLLYSLIFYAVIRSNKLLTAYVNSKVQLEKVMNDQLNTELKFLKAQYHPHFLFNALNTVYFQMDENIAEAKKTVEKFSELLRYQLYDQRLTVPISQEIEYLKNFIDIQKVRSTERLRLHTLFDPALNGQQVYPLLFLPLVENAFKYVGGDYQLDIEVKGSAGEIEFTVVNSLPLQRVPEKTNGIGLENLKRRLELLYPGRHQFDIEKKDHRYKAHLKLLI